MPTLGVTFSFYRFKTGMASLNLRLQFLRNAESVQIFLKILWHLRQILTGPSVCTTANEKVYIAGKGFEIGFGEIKGLKAIDTWIPRSRFSLESPKTPGYAPD